MGNMEGGSFAGDFEERCTRKLWRRVFLSVGAHWGTWGVRCLGILEIAGGLRKGIISFCRSSVRGGSFWESGRIWG